MRWKNATGMRDFTQIAERVTKRLHGKNTGPWSLGFKVYRDVSQGSSRQVKSQLQIQQQQPAVLPKDTKFMYQVSLAQQPGQVYCMVDGSVVVEAEKELEIILSRLKNLWQLRQSVAIEVWPELIGRGSYSLLIYVSLRVQATKLVILPFG